MKSPEAVSLHIQTVPVNSLNKQEDNRHTQPLWVSAQLDTQVHQFDCEVDTAAGCRYYAPVHLQVTVNRQETRDSHSSHQWIW